MNLIGRLATIATALLFLSSCAITNEVHFNKNFSGTYTTTLDYSAVYDMIESFGGEADMDMNDSPFGDQFDTEQQAKIKEMMNSAEGISNANWSLSDEDKAMTVSFDFDDVESMEKAFELYEKRMIEESGEAQSMGISPNDGLGMLSQFSREGKVVSFDGVVPNDVLDNLSNEMDLGMMDSSDAFGMMGEMLDYTLIMTFDKKIKDVTVEGMDILTQDKKSIKTRIDVGKMMKGDAVKLDVRVK